MERTLFGLRTSPWTERACWALDHHAVAYDYHEHVPFLGELLLRRKAGVKHPTVPLLADGDEAIMGSAAIARRADAIGAGSPLFPKAEADAAAAERWIEVSEQILGVARGWALRRLRESPGACAEALPAFMPGPLRSLLAPTSKTAIDFVRRKYAANDGDPEQIATELRPRFAEIREALGGQMYLLGDFSIADIAVAGTTQILGPHASAKIGPATREAWRHDDLAREFADLVLWRDELYAKQRLKAPEREAAR
jgi:glutathione S-transferase